MSILDLQGLPLPEAQRGTAMGPQNSNASLLLCDAPTMPSAVKVEHGQAQA